MPLAKWLLTNYQLMCILLIDSEYIEGDELDMKQIRNSAIAVMMGLCLVITFNANIGEASVKLPQKLYKVVKGRWYTQASSSGFNVRFTRKRVNYYDRKTNKVVHSGRIKKVKKLKRNRYRIVFQNAKGISSFVSKNEKADAFDFFGSAGSKGYSGGSGIEKGKW